MVVRVVVRERTEGAGEEKVLSPPLRDSTPPVAVRLVPVTDDVPWEGAVTDRDVSWSVETVGAMDVVPAVGGGRSSAEERREVPGLSEVALETLVLREENE